MTQIFILKEDKAAPTDARATIDISSTIIEFFSNKDNLIDIYRIREIIQFYILQQTSIRCF
jgi:hypothetical protein